jgi:NTP pyrophosphatase (non-canonical NTP hydrolase)
MASYRDIEMNVLMWGDARRITKNGTALGQASKTVEEAVELLTAVAKRDIKEAEDAIGDVLVTLVMTAALLDLDVVECFAHAYDQIKDRKGYLNENGVFVKEAA